MKQKYLIKIMNINDWYPNKCLIIGRRLIDDSCENLRGNPCYLLNSTPKTPDNLSNEKIV